MAHRLPRGYGTTRVARRNTTAHRVAWMLANEQDAPQGRDVCHTCDNPPCCNPAHLFVGTRADNMADCVAKGRISDGERHSALLKRVAARGEAHGLRLHPERAARGGANGSRKHPERLPRGSSVHNAKLSERDIPGIRAAIVTGESYSSIARRYGVSTMAIYNIKRGKAWRHA